MRGFQTCLVCHAPSKVVNLRVHVGASEDCGQQICDMYAYRMHPISAIRILKVCQIWKRRAPALLAIAN